LYKTHFSEALVEVLGKTLKNKNISEHCPHVKRRERKLQWYCSEKKNSRSGDLPISGPKHVARNVHVTDASG
jgi:hypothetical protein